MMISFKSVLAPDITSFIEMKRALGYKYAVEEYILQKFDEYWIINNGVSDLVDMDALAGWVKQRSTESKTSQYCRINTVKLFLQFRNSIGKRSYIPMNRIRCARHPLVHVLSSAEIKALFDEIDAYMPARPSKESFRMSKEYPVLFRLILTSGLRRSEAVSLRTEDFDAENRTILIRNAKGHKDRIIVITDDMNRLLKEYILFMERQMHGTMEWVFPSVDPKCHLSSGALSEKFNRCWNRTRYAEACLVKPTVHSLRHTFVVIRINAWIKDGINTVVMLPYLSRYLGHKSPDETFYYYHQVIDNLQVIKEKDTLSSVLPEVRVR